MFPLLWVPELFRCLNYQLLTATTHNDRNTAVFWLTSSPTHFTPLCSTQLTIVLLITSRHGPHRKHRSSVCFIHCCVRSHWRGLCRKHRFPASPQAHIRNLLPSNGRCLESLLGKGSACYNIYLTSELDGSEWSVSRPFLFTRGKEHTVPFGEEAGCVPRWSGPCAEEKN
jgi:hypothetical protein